MKTQPYTWILQRHPQSQNLEIILPTLLSCVSLHKFRTKDCVWLSWLACVLICSSGRISICSFRLFFPPAICDKYLLAFAVSLCLFKQWLLCNSFFTAELLRYVAYTLAKFPKWAFPASLMCRTWWKVRKGVRILCKKADTPHRVESIRPRIVWSRT